MTVIRKTTVVPYSAEEMYALVNDVESYATFLPWCSEATIHSQDEHSMIASMTLSVGGIKQSFSTKSALQPGRRIELSLLTGPFKYLNGYWQFEPASDRHCRIDLEMSFEFKNKIMRLALNKIFNHIINSLVDTFSKRARQIYGNR